jgi:hypothetical protein
MAYFTVDDQFAWHHKSVQAGNAAIGVWTRCGSWSAGQRLDGHVPEDVARAVGKPAEIAALVRAGLWEPVEGGYRMHDYADHNTTAAQAIALSAKRAAAGRKGGRRRPGLRSVSREADDEASA